jgi:hypothetical protein
MVTFMDGATTIGTGTVSGGIATLTYPFAAAGGHPITATYGGDSNHLGSTSGAVSQSVVNAVPTNAKPVAYDKAIAITVKPFHDDNDDDDRHCHNEFDRRQGDGHFWNRHWQDDDDDWDREWERDADDAHGVRITLTATDVDSSRLTFRIVTGPQHGLLSRVRRAMCQPDGTGCSARVIYVPQPHYTGGDTFTYVANDGTSDSNVATVVVNLVPPFVTFNQGAWGAPPHGENPGDFLSDNFLTVFSSGVVIGSGKTLTFQSASKVEKFLPAGGQPGVLAASAINPSTSKGGVLAGSVLALQLNVAFSSAGITRAGLGSLTVTKGPLKNKTVNQVLALANGVLGGTQSLPSGVSLSDLNDVVSRINDNYASGHDDKGYLQ